MFEKGYGLTRVLVSCAFLSPKKVDVTP